MPVVIAAPRRAVRPAIADRQEGFIGGLNSVSDPSAVGSDQCVRSDNARLSEYGAVTKRGGTQRISTAVIDGANAVKSGFAWRQDASTVYGLVEVNAAIWRFTWGTFPRTLTSIGVVVDVPVGYSAFRDGSANVVYFASGTNLKKWDGTTFSSIAAASQATGITAYNERLWGWGVSGSLDSLFYSALDNGDTLGVGASGGGQIVVRTMGQDNIIACAPLNTSLMIFHRNGISRLTGYGQSDVTVSPEAVSGDWGLVGAKALALYDNVAYGVSARGLFRCNEAEVVPLATPQKPDPVAAQLPNLSKDNLALVVCTFNRKAKEVWVQLPGIGIYIYHTILQSWSGPFVDGFLSPDTTCLFEMLDTTDQPFMCRGDSSGYVSQCEPTNVYKDNVVAAGTGGTVYDMVVQCHRMYGRDAKTGSQDQTSAVGWLWAHILASLMGSASATINWNTLTDAGSFQIGSGTGTTVAWGSGTWGVGTWGAGGQAPFYVRLSGAGPFIDLTIIDSGEAAAIYAAVKVTGVTYGRR